jgi:predicted RNA binding protein YcfA (HicA-like mRNA interferase family)
VPKLPRVPSSLVLRALKRAGFYIYHQTGSHVQLRHHVKELRITVPSGKRDLAPKTLKAIIMQAGLTIKEFINDL